MYKLNNHNLGLDLLIEENKQRKLTKNLVQTQKSVPLLSDYVHRIIATSITAHNPLKHLTFKPYLAPELGRVAKN